MKKIILIIMLFVVANLTAQELVKPVTSQWINVKGIDYKIARIDTLQGIVIVEGSYDIKITEDDTIITNTGGLGKYFFYKDNLNNVKINLPKEMIEVLEDKTYGIKEILEIK